VPGGVAVFRIAAVTNVISNLLQSGRRRKLKNCAAFIAVFLAICCGTAVSASAAGPSAIVARAMRGDPVAQARLGWLFLNGRGVPQDFTEAAKWFYRAATHGNGGAQYELGMLYNKGQGVRRDYVLSYLWLNLSAAQATGADRDFKTTMRDAIANKMTPAQILAAQKMALEWYKSQ
jgi:uncharacterized protein